MYDYKLLNNHYVVDINGHHFIIDTGAPFSYSFVNGLNEVIINGVGHKLRVPSARFNVRKTHTLVGYPVDGLLGADSFKETGFTIYKDNEEGGRIDFAVNKISGKSYRVLTYANGSAPLIQTDNGKLYLVDTGARYGYGAKEMFNGLSSFATVWDYNPDLGDLNSPIYNVEVAMNNKKCHTTACYNSNVTFHIPNFLMIGNITDFFEKECCFDYQGDRVVLNQRRLNLQPSFSQPRFSFGVLLFEAYRFQNHSRNYLIQIGNGV